MKMVEEDEHSSSLRIFIFLCIFNPETVKLWMEVYGKQNVLPCVNVRDAFC